MTYNHVLCGSISEGKSWKRLPNDGILKLTNGTIGYTPDNSSDWDNAVSWGNHAEAGYLTSQLWRTGGNIYDYVTPDDGSYGLLIGDRYDSDSLLTVWGGAHIGGGMVIDNFLDVGSDVIRVRTSKTPSSSGATGNAGDICWDNRYIYICIMTNTWRRTALSSW